MPVEIPTADPSTIGLVLLAFLAGSACPTYYTQERLRGFGRLVVSKLPYKSPPGQEEQEAMAEATEEGRQS